MAGITLDKSRTADRKPPIGRIGVTAFWELHCYYMACLNPGGLVTGGIRLGVGSSKYGSRLTECLTDQLNSRKARVLRQVSTIVNQSDRNGCNQFFEGEQRAGACARNTSRGKSELSLMDRW
jgi:hypothetical protein